MTIKICDVCLYEAKQQTRSKWRISFRNSFRRLALDVCMEHQHYFKTCRDFDEAAAKVDKLYGIDRSVVVKEIIPVKLGNV